MVVPQVSQVPFIIGRPFFIVVSSPFNISRFALHFTQYASAMRKPPPLLVIDISITLSGATIAKVIVRDARTYR